MNWNYDLDAAPIETNLLLAYERCGSLRWDKDWKDRCGTWSMERELLPNERITPLAWCAVELPE